MNPILEAGLLVFALLLGLYTLRLSLRDLAEVTNDDA